MAGHHFVLPHHRSGTRHFPGTCSMQLSPTWRSLQVVIDILQDMMYVCMDGWMDGWTEGWMDDDGCMDGWMDGWMDR